MNDELFNELEESVREASRHARGEADAPPEAVTVVGGPDARAIRKRLGLSQPEFAAALEVPLSTLRNWEQGRRRPDAPAVKLLKIAAAHPEVLLASA